MHSYRKDIPQERSSPAFQDVFLPRLLPVVCQDGVTRLTSTLLLSSLSPWLRSLLEISPGETAILLPQVSPDMWLAWIKGEEAEEVNKLLNPKVKELDIKLDKVEEESKPHCETTFDNFEDVKKIIGLKNSGQANFEQSEEGEVGPATNKSSAKGLVVKRGRGRPRKFRNKTEEHDVDVELENAAKKKNVLTDSEENEELKESKYDVKVEEDFQDSYSDLKNYKKPCRSKLITFECQVCGKDFEKLGKIARHRAYNRHTRWCTIKSFSCDCSGLPKIEHKTEEMGNKRKFQLKIKEKHMKDVHLGRDWFQCMMTLYCDISFETLNALEVHINEKHQRKTNNT